ncbi:flagellin [Bdellovibrio sp. HCB337]|uniref:flagellin N-terminal helical domain-containing protein n=1 Tax=Bdellovibrio sp. HCB337 TaxID=3394358 RepID=UPI0039A70663
MLRVTPVTASLMAQRYLGTTQRSTEKAMKDLASGTRFSSPGADAAGAAIAEQIRGQVRGQKAALNNADNATSFIQVAEGALNEQNNILIRLRELAVQAASDTYSDKEREYLNYEYTQLAEELDRIAKTTTFGTTALLNGRSRDYEFQVGTSAGDDSIIRYTSDTDTTATELGVDGGTIESKSDARSNLKEIDDAMMKVSAARAKYGAIQSRMDSAANNLQVGIENLTSAHSRMADTDVAQAISDVRRGQILQQYQASVLSQANTTNETMLRLIA